LINTDAGSSKNAEETLLVSAGIGFSEEGSKHLRNNGTYTSARIALYSRTMGSSSAPLLETSVRIVHDYSQKKEAVISSQTPVYITICLAECPRRRQSLSTPS
jgi:hypothetical protein